MTAATGSIALPRALGGYPVVLPSVRDPRLHLSAVIVTLHVIGQLAFDFEVSVAQILVAIGTAAAVDLAVVFKRERVVAWPASALLTGNGTAFILRVDGTEHGEWWSLEGWWIFAGTAALGVLSKYAVRIDGRPLFNPSNVALVLCFLLLGSGRVEPLDFWWGPMSPWLTTALAVILVGGLTLARRVGMLAVSAAFWLTFAASLAFVARSGHCLTARWHVGPVCDRELWTTLVGSPEVLVFLFFMITDPKTVPTGRRARLAYGVGVGFLSALLVATQRTEFGAKVGVLGALVVACAARPVLERLLPAVGRRPRIELALWSVAAVSLAASALVATAGGAPRVDALAAAPAAPPAPVSPPPAGGEVADLAPVLEVPPTPPVTIDGSVDEVSGGVEQDTATRMASDVVRALVAEAEAVLAGDASLASAHVSGARMERLQRAVAEASASAEVSVTLPEPESATVVVVRLEDGPQAVPWFAVHLRGTAARRWYEGSPREQAAGRAEERTELDSVFVVVASESGYRIVDELPPPAG